MSMYEGALGNQLIFSNIKKMIKQPIVVNASVGGGIISKLSYY